jgi:hypothetical protein
MHFAYELDTRKFSALHLQMRFRKPRRDDARRSWSNVRLCTVNVVIFQPTGTVHQERLA